MDRVANQSNLITM